MALFYRNDSDKLVYNQWDDFAFDEWFEEAVNQKEVEFVLNNLLEDVLNACQDRCNNLGINFNDLNVKFP